jgi:hypothetical protein
VPLFGPGGGIVLPINQGQVVTPEVDAVGDAHPKDAAGDQDAEALRREPYPVGILEMLPHLASVDAGDTVGRERERFEKVVDRHMGSEFRRPD